VWKVDDSHSPIHLDFVMTRADGQTKTIELILKFVSDNQIVLRADWNTGKRPDGFVENDPDTQITLTRQPLP
jgi:hypothetical protein